MTYIITTKDADGVITGKYPAIGDRNALMDAAYDDGAYGVSAMAVA